jgi:DNA-binding MarR family transcriptional regulator
MADANGIEPDEWELWRAFRAAQAQLALGADRSLRRENGMTAAEYGTLNAIREAEGGRLRVTDLADQLGWERSRVSHQVARMEERGLVIRSESAADGRVAEVQLTTAGRRKLVGAIRGHADFVRRSFLDQVRPQERAALLAVLGRVLAQAAQDGAAKTSVRPRRPAPPR